MNTIKTLCMSNDFNNAIKPIFDKIKIKPVEFDFWENPDELISHDFIDFGDDLDYKFIITFTTKEDSIVGKIKIAAIIENLPENEVKLGTVVYKDNKWTLK